MTAQSQPSQPSQGSQPKTWQDMTAEERETKIAQWAAESAAMPKTKIGRIRAIVQSGPYGVQPGRARKLSARIDRHLSLRRHYTRTARYALANARPSLVFGEYDQRARIEGDRLRAAVKAIEIAAGLPFDDRGLLSAGGNYAIYYLAAEDLDAHNRGSCFVLCVDCANESRKDGRAIIIGYGSESDTDSHTACEDCGRVIIEDWDKDDRAAAVLAYEETTLKAAMVARGTDLASAGYPAAIVARYVSLLARKAAAQFSALHEDDQQSVLDAAAEDLAGLAGE